MILPPRVKTQYPRTNDIPIEEITPIPIETVFFLSDGEQDKSQLNRYYFNYPGNWATSNNGENIIGLRSIKVQKNVFNLEFTIQIAKYNFMDFLDFRQDTLNDTIDYLLENKKDETKSIFLNIIYSIRRDEIDYDNLFDAINEIMINTINQRNYGDFFVQNPNDPNDRDVNIKGFYNKDGYSINIYSERNTRLDKNVVFKLYSANDDFIELFNINNFHKDWRVILKFNKVWDLKPCYVYSSIAEQSHHHYIGTTDVEYSEIKYYKLNSSDQRFWVEFHSMNKDRTPSYFPKNVSFAIELQFQSFNKRLNV